MRSVTKQGIREARLKEIKEELLHSERLKTYFEDNPRDLQLLRHDLPLHPAVVKPHLGHVPDYLGERARGPWVLGAVPQTGPWRPGGSSAQAHTSARRGPQMLPSGLERGGAHLGHTRSRLPVACG